MSTLQLAEYIGQSAIWTADPELQFRVRIVDVKRAYGRCRFLVEPLEGTGRRWIDREKLILTEAGHECE